MKLTWNSPGTRLYEAGVSKAVLYPMAASGTYGNGIAWNGMISVSGYPSGGEASPIYANNVKIAETYGVENFTGEIEAFTYPDEFSHCDGSYTAVPGMRIGPVTQRNRFGLVVRTEVGNDLDDLFHGYKLHIYYGCLATASDESYNTLSEQPDMTHFKWHFTALPRQLTGFSPSPYLCIDSRRTGEANMNFLEDMFYGTPWTDPVLLSPEEIFDIIEDHDDTWIGGIFAVIPDTTKFPYYGTYLETVTGFYKNLDKRSF